MLWNLLDMVFDNHHGEIIVITFDSGGRNGTMPTQLIKIDEIRALNLNQFSKAGYVFIGCSTIPNGDAEYENGSTFSKKK